MSETASEQGKTRALIAHITLIGWIIAVVMNNEEKDDYASFYIRQVLGIFIIGILVSTIGFVIPILQIILPLAVLAIWILSLVWAVSGEKKAIPGVGDLFQDWFKAL